MFPINITIGSFDGMMSFHFHCTSMDDATEQVRKHIKWILHRNEVSPAFTYGVCKFIGHACNCWSKIEAIKLARLLDASMGLQEAKDFAEVCSTIN